MNNVGVSDIPWMRRRITIRKRVLKNFEGVRVGKVRSRECLDVAHGCRGNSPFRTLLLDAIEPSQARSPELLILIYRTLLVGRVDLRLRLEFECRTAKARGQPGLVYRTSSLVPWIESPQDDCPRRKPIAIRHSHPRKSVVPLCRRS